MPSFSKTCILMLFILAFLNFVNCPRYFGLFFIDYIILLKSEFKAGVMSLTLFLLYFIEEFTMSPSGCQSKPNLLILVSCGAQSKYLVVISHR